MEKRGVHYFNMLKIAYSRAGWVLSLPNTAGILFLIWTNAHFQENYARHFLYNFWFFMICIVLPFGAYMVFEYRRVWSAEIEIFNQRSWEVGHNPVRDLLVQNARDIGELKAMVKGLGTGRKGA
ncbi:MAG: hypothetical protein FJ149_12940 [Euryarchaeota archaeon]|nr:hypothetical protein [Euryarchaeota archaeon]